MDPLFRSSLRTYRRNGIWTFPHGMDRSNDRDRGGISCRGGQFEALADLVSPEYNEAIKRTKDLAAGAVLLMAIAAAIVGFIIFIPKIATIF